jgi:FixJ family two-component response regulator
MWPSGTLNTQIAGAIGVSEITVTVHRGQVMRKSASTAQPLRPPR